MQDLDGVVPELHVEGKVESQLDADLLVDVGGGALSHGGEHRIDGEHPADEEGDEKQAGKGRRRLRDDPESGEGVNRRLRGESRARAHFFAIA